MRNKGAAWLAIVVLALAGFMAANCTRASEDDEKAVREAAEQFYAALNAMFTGDLGPMETVWSHADDVTYMGPGGGFQVGWAQVLANWEAQAAADPLKEEDDEEKKVLEKCKRKASGKMLVIIAGGWSYPSVQDEIADIGKDSWRPTTADFLAAAQAHGGSPPLSASTPNEFFRGIANQSKGSIGRVVFIGHGGIDGILFSGDSSTGRASTRLDTNDIPNFLSFIKNNVRPKLHPNAKIDLVTCTNGADKVFMDAMANAFNRCIRGFDTLIEFRNPTVDDTKITRRGFTRVAGEKKFKKGWKHLGFHVCVCT